MKTYTGVGSRVTPQPILERMENMAHVLAHKGVTLRTGAASGADEAFERGCDHVEGPKEIYLPWEGFRGRDDSECVVVDCFSSLHLASMIHPNWEACDPSARALHARNVCQVVGQDCDHPSLFLICWTPDGRPVGGTRTAIVMAQRNHVPVFNLASRAWTLTEILTECVRRKRASA